MKYTWTDLPEKKNCFTVRSATMINLNTGEIVRHYAANTKIVVVQKCITPECTYYRTSEAAHHYLNYAFRASAFGLPNEEAPSAPIEKDLNSLEKKASKSGGKSCSGSCMKPSSAKQKQTQKEALSKDGETRQPQNWIKKLFRRKNGKAKNS